MLNPAKGLIAWQYFSHKVLRWLTPFLLALTFITNLLLWEKPFYRLILVGQIIFYTLAGIGYLLCKWGKARGIPYAIFFFCFTNLATIAGFWRYITKGQAVTWQKVR
jgi:hypothetical protein